MPYEAQAAPIGRVDERLSTGLRVIDLLAAHGYGPSRQRPTVYLYIGASGRSRPHLPRGVRAAQAQGKITSAGLASLRYMSKSLSRRFPVTVTRLPVTRCEICRRTVAYRPGSLSEVLTEHYRRAHPEALGVPPR